MKKIKFVTFVVLVAISFTGLNLAPKRADAIVASGTAALVAAGVVMGVGIVSWSSLGIAWAGCREVSENCSQSRQIGIIAGFSAASAFLLGGIILLEGPEQTPKFIYSEKRAMAAELTEPQKKALRKYIPFLNASVKEAATELGDTPIRTAEEAINAARPIVNALPKNAQIGLAKILRYNYSLLTKADKSNEQR